MPCVPIRLFQFHKGTIKTLTDSVPISKESYFNSIKVRLKHEPSAYNVDSLLFQFHKGTIKTIVGQGIANAAQTFQFHKGTIKTFCTW